MYAKKRGIGKKLILTIRAVMLDEKVDLVARDFNGAASRGDNRNNISTIEEAFADCALPMPPGSTPLWGPRAIPGKWGDVCGFLKHPDSDGQWQVRQHGAFSIPHEALGIRPTDQSCHHEAWLHFHFVGWRDEQPHREKHDRRILLKERFCAVPLRQTQRTHQRRYERPFAVLVVGGHSPSVRTFGRFLSTRTTRTSSPSDLMSLPPFLTATSVSFFPRSVIHIACMTISSWCATKKKVKRMTCPSELRG